LFNQSEGIFGSPPNFLIWLIEKKDNNKIKKLARAQPKSNRYFARYEPYTSPLPLITWNKDKLKTSWLLSIFRHFKFIEFCEIIINGKMYEPIFRKFFQNIILT
jgi:hypothetical protein